MKLYQNGLYKGYEIKEMKEFLKPGIFKSFVKWRIKKYRNEPDEDGIKYIGNKMIILKEDWEEFLNEPLSKR